MKNKLKKVIIIYHLIFPFICWFFIISNPKESDSERFIGLVNESDNWFSLFEMGTPFVSFLIYPLVKTGIDLLMLNLIFSLISLKGFLIYFEIFEKKNYFSSTNFLYLFLLLFLLPSLHFWTGFLGKDVIVFLTMALVLRAIVNKYYGKPLLWLMLILSFLTRPHSVIILAIGVFISFLFFSKYAVRKKISYALLMLVLFLITIPFLIKHFLNIKDFHGIKDLVFTFYNNVQEYNSTRGSHFFDIFETPYIEKLSVLMFRPLFFDAKNNLQYIASFENLILVITLIMFTFLFLKFKPLKIAFSYKFALITSILFWLIIGTYIFNLGQASRMKVMILPYMLYALISILIDNNIRYIEKKNN